MDLKCPVVHDASEWPNTSPSIGQCCQIQHLSEHSTPPWARMQGVASFSKSMLCKPVSYAVFPWLNGNSLKPGISVGSEEWHACARSVRELRVCI